jgi:ketosteroid isomerase-like protein
MLSWGWGYVLPIALLVCLGAVYETSTNEETNGPSEAWWIKQSRLNKGDVSALDDFWDENADYVGVDGTLIKGRAQMQAFFRKVAESSKGQQIASVEQIRFITPELATVDGSWTVTGARGADGKELAPIQR